jgi:outer membrane protein assembly factor BamB
VIDTETGAVSWTKQLSENDTWLSPPVISGEIVYASEQPGQLDAFHVETGERIWQIQFDGDQMWAVPETVDGTLYVGADNCLHALDAATGEPVWRFETAGYPLPAMSEMGEYMPSRPHSNGAIFLGTPSGTVHAIDLETGTQRWQFSDFELEGGDHLYAPTASETTVIVVTRDAEVYGLDVEDGSVEWTRSLDLRGVGTMISPPVASGDTAYIGGYLLLALDLTSGAVRWRYGGGDGHHRVIAAAGDTLYLGQSTVERGGAVHALVPTGSVQLPLDTIRPILGGNAGERTLRFSIEDDDHESFTYSEPSLPLAYVPGLPEDLSYPSESALEGTTLQGFVSVGPTRDSVTGQHQREVDHVLEFTATVTEADDHYEFALDRLDTGATGRLVLRIERFPDGDWHDDGDCYVAALFETATGEPPDGS